jgi:hypothetical protein
LERVCERTGVLTRRRLESAASDGPFAAAAAWDALTSVNPVNGEYWWGRASAAEAAGRFSEAVWAYERAWQLGFSIRAETAFRSGRCRALAGDVSGALDWLRRAFSNGFRRPFELTSDVAFAPYRDDPAFRDPALESIVQLPTGTAHDLPRLAPNVTPDITGPDLSR